MKTPIIGQTLYSLNIGSAARHTPQTLRPVVVRRVGRKFFGVSPEAHPSLLRDYHLDSWRERGEYSPDTALYESEQAWADEKECAALCKQISDAFLYGRNALGLSLETIRKIHSQILTTPPDSRTGFKSCSVG